MSIFINDSDNTNANYHNSTNESMQDNDKRYKLQMTSKPTAVYIPYQPLYDLRGLQTRSVLVDNFYHIEKIHNNVIYNEEKRIERDITIESTLRDYDKPLQWGGEQYNPNR
jgi:hypothetical protein